MSLSPEERRRLLAGEILTRREPVEGSVPELVVTALFDRPPEAVWRVLDRAEDYATVFPAVKESRVLARAGESLETRLVIGMPFPLRDLVEHSSAQHAVGDGRWTRSWRSRARLFERNEGSWTLTRFEDDPQRTLAVYRIHLVPSIPMPQRLLTFLTRTSTRQLIEAVRRHS